MTSPGQPPAAPGSVRFRPRERRLALIAGVVVGSWLIVSLLVQPLWDRVRDLHERVEAHTEKLVALNHLLQQAPMIEEQYQQIAGYLSGEEGERARSAFLDALETLSRGSDLQVNFKPRQVKREGRMSRFEVELDVEGPQEKLLAFLDGLITMPTFMTIDRLRISSVPAKEHQLRASLVIQKLTLQH